MTSKKRSARQREIAAFKASLFEPGDASGVDDIFAREDRRREQAQEEREEALRYKACERKNRYATRAEAEENLAWCEAQGKRGLHIYRCEYCKGWHLTSKPER